MFFAKICAKMSDTYIAAASSDKKTSGLRVIKKLTSCPKFDWPVYVGLVVMMIFLLLLLFIRPITPSKPEQQDDIDIIVSQELVWEKDEV